FPLSDADNFNFTPVKVDWRQTSIWRQTSNW
ncbi:MAG: hypothetical protein ACI814_003525, partial [Mariniblastus sp.]